MSGKLGAGKSAGTARSAEAVCRTGSHIVYASTFTGNRIKLEEYGLQERLEEINTQLVALSRQAVGDQALVAGDMTMTGQQLFPMGELLFEELMVFTGHANPLYWNQAVSMHWYMKTIP